MVPLSSPLASSATAATRGGSGAYTNWRGTSFSSPVVAGIAALLLQQNHTLSPSQVAALIVETATTEVVIDPGYGSPNRLAFSRGEAPSVPPLEFAVFIDGPAQVEPNDTCIWYAMVSGGSEPYSYEWRRNGDLVGTSSEYTASDFSSSFDLVVSVGDASGAARQAGIQVTVESGVGACYF